MGTDPGKKSTKKQIERDIHFRCVSYSHDIIQWLTACKKETVNHPILRETITQYIYLLQYLTNQTTNHKMADDIIKQILQSEDNLLAFFEIAKASGAVYDGILQRFKGDLESLANQNSLNLTFGVRRDESNTSFYFTSPGLDKLNVSIRFHFEGQHTKDFYFGFSWNTKTNIDPEIKTKLSQEFIKYFPDCKTASTEWAVFVFWNEYRNWTPETYLKVYRREMVPEVANQLKIMMDIVNSLSGDTEKK